jgi:hypothetical protein
METFRTGATVKVRCADGRTLIRRVVADKGHTVVVCNTQEFETATKLQRRPEGVGFPRKDVLATESNGGNPPQTAPGSKSER